MTRVGKKNIFMFQRPSVNVHILRQLAPQNALRCKYMDTKFKRKFVLSNRIQRLDN